MEIQQRIDRGESPDDARMNARRDFGNVGLVKEVTRETLWGARAFDRFEQDVRYSFRFLVKTLKTEFASTMVILLTLAIAIAANTTIFGLVNALVFKTQAGVGNPEQLVSLGDSTRFRLRSDLLSKLPRLPERGRHI